MSDGEERAVARVRVWDLGTRIFHWALVVLIPFSWYTGEEGDMELHIASGTAILTLVLFRLLWGLWGSDTARFARFLRGPGAVIAYLKGWLARAGGTTVGHNPAGGWMVALMLLALAVQPVLGLFSANEDNFTEGPLAHLVSSRTSDMLLEWHELVFNVIVALAVLHVLAVLLYLVHQKDNLIGPMFTGHKSFGAPVAPPGLRPFWQALLTAVLAYGLVWVITTQL